MISLARAKRPYKTEKLIVYHAMMLSLFGASVFTGKERVGFTRI
jgi:hypothetical protein